jgi:N-acetylglucosamine-6-phosphate deacetylase
MEMTPLQTEQRARTPEEGTLAGSTRKMERQSGQLTFIHSLRSDVHREMPAAAPAA